jgi:hypothetical protein
VKEPTVLRMLADLGMDDLSYRALPLLPLVEVAWADGGIQDAEKRMIEGLVERFGGGEEARRHLDNWCAYAPTPEYFRRGREALAALLAKEPEHELGDNVAAQIVDLAKQVAKSAGGVFGIGATSRTEQAVIDELSRVLAGGAPASPPASPLGQSFGAAPRGPNRVTITFTTTTTMEAAASGGVLEYDGQKYPVDRKGLVIGAGDAADLRVENDPEVKANHCRFHETNRKFYVTAADPSAPVLVNGERVLDRRLIGGEIVRIGAIELVFKLLRKIPKQLV